MPSTYTKPLRCIARLALAVALTSSSALLAPPCQAQEDYPRPLETMRTYQIFLLGNTGTPAPDDLAPTLELLQRQLATAGQESAVVFLGDQLHDGGMPEVGAPGRAEAEGQLMPLVEAVRDYVGKVFVIPGDKDAGDGQDRVEALRRQEAFLEEHLDRGNVVRPNEGGPGPDDVKLTDDLRLIILNTDWLLQNTPASAGNDDVEEPIDVYMELEDIIKHRHGDDLVVVGHHPIYSNGRYGGHRSPYYLLPGLGTAAYAATRAGGDAQYFSHKRNEWMRQTLRTLLTVHQNFIYVAAHDYSLQHFEYERVNRLKDFVVSGSAARSGYVAKGHDPGGYDTKLTTNEKGFVSLTYYADGSIWLDAWGVNDGGRHLNEAMLRRPALPPALPDAVASGTYPNYADSTITLSAEPAFKAGLIHRLLFGSNRRKMWTTEVEVPYLDLAMHGGLRPVKRGGSAQTTSIRLENPDGKQYVLRSVTKETKRSLPLKWQSTVVASIGQDVSSYMHPYGAIPVPRMADAVGVYHANPRLVYVPDDPRLGIYRDLVGGTLMIFEERPNNDHWAETASLGRSDDIIGWAEMYRNVTRDNDDRIDARALARNRLFDMWLGDWDRHKDQWRWATFDDPDGDGKLYRPIPRDRDNAFNHLNFILSGYFKAFLDFHYVGFQKMYHLKGLTTNGRSQDHRFLSSLDRSAWLEIADSVQAALTDEIIDSGLRDLPPAAYAVNHERILEFGQVRREKLPRIAEKFYRLHARSVDVVGSHKHERFEVTRLDGGDTEVVVYSTTKEGQIRQEIYRRVLHRSETREINLYGLGGTDQFVIQGDGPRAIRVNAVGGPGADTFVDESRAGKVHFYDTPAAHNTWQPGPKTRVHQSDDPADNDYPMAYQYERIIPFGLPGYNSDDGLLLSISGSYTRHAFQKKPYAQQHTLSGGFASKRQAFNATYSGTYTSVFGDWDLGTKAAYRSPGNITNFYGLGNETVRDDDTPPLFETGLGQFSVELPLMRQYEMGIALEVAPTLQVARIDEKRAGNLLDLEQPGLSEPTTEAQVFTGLRAELGLAYQDDANNPRLGYAWTTSVQGNLGVHNTTNNYATVSSALALYASLPTTHQVTLAVRAGGAHNVGTFPFYTASTLGGTTNLRGFRSTRFSGRTSFYTNAEVRLALFSVKWAALPGRVGVLGFIDHGRVWTDEESSDKWHQGYGGGVWYNIVDEIVLNFTYGESEEGTHLLGGIGFLF